MKFLDMSGGFSLAQILFQVLLAAVCGGIIGIERMLHGRAAGMRTHILVCIGSTMTIMTGFYVNEVFTAAADPLRIGAQVISGIGFLGVGTILIKGKSEVMGLTTAAGLWTTAAIGLAIGSRFYIGALIATFIAFITIVVLSRAEKIMTRRIREVKVYLELAEVGNVNSFLEEFAENRDVIELNVTAPRSAVSGNVGIEIILHASDAVQTKQTIEHMKQLPFVLYAMETVA